jgi:hypothetical protein
MRLASAQDRPDARHQFRRCERLRQKIIGPGIECGHGARSGPAGRGDDDHGDGAAASELVEQLEAVEVRRRRIEQHDVGRVLKRTREAAPTVVLAFHRDPARRAEVTQHRAQRHVVVDEEYFDDTRWRHDGPHPQTALWRHFYVDEFGERLW